MGSESLIKKLGEVMYKYYSVIHYDILSKLELKNNSSSKKYEWKLSKQDKKFLNYGN